MKERKTTSRNADRALCSFKQLSEILEQHIILQWWKQQINGTFDLFLLHYSSVCSDAESSQDWCQRKLAPAERARCSQSNWSSHIIDLILDLGRAPPLKVETPPSAVSWSTALWMSQANVFQALKIYQLNVIRTTQNQLVECTIKLAK